MRPPPCPLPTPLPIPPSRTIELEVIILATPPEIWNALATSEGLSPWFPPIAEGGGAPGAELRLSWGEGIDWRIRITEWDESRHLQWSNPPKIDPGSSADEIPVAIDWYLGPASLNATTHGTNDGLLLIELEQGATEYHFGIYLSLYGIPRRDVEVLRSWIARAADGALA